MSSSRSVAAAQRRRAGPTPDVQASRGPSTSINSTQAFTQNQQAMRPGTTGRLAGQQAVLNQKQQQQAQFENTISAELNVSPLKMTVAQVIQLITLRLGKLEQQIQNLELSKLSESSSTGPSASVDSSVINDIILRIENLEQNRNDITSCKQQLEALKPAIVSVKNLSTGSSNEVTTLKKLIEEIKTDINATKLAVSHLQTFVEPNDNHTLDKGYSIQIEETSDSSSVSNVSAVINLKNIIEQELNANI